MGRSYSLLYILLESVRNIRDNGLTTIVTIVTIGFSLAIFTLFLLVSINISTVIQKWGEQIQVVVYLKDGIPRNEVGRLRKIISNVDGVDKVDYISKESALNILKRELKGYKGVLDAMVDNPLPLSFEVKINESYRSTDKIRYIVSKLEKLEWVDDMQYGREWVERFAGLLKFVELFTLVVGVFLTVAVVFIVSNTVKLAVYARKSEIEITRLIGASNLYIKSPFFVEGVFEGLVGGFMAAGLILLGVKIMSMNVPAMFLHLVAMPVRPLVLLCGLVVAGISFGVVGSMVSLGRFLKV